VRERLAVAGWQRGRDQVAVAVVAGGLGFRGPDRVKGGEVVSVGQVAAPGLGSREFGAVAAEDIGEHGDRLALARPAWAGRRRLVREVSRAFAAKAFVAVEFGSGPGTGLGVGGAGRGGEHEGKVDIGAAGHGRVQPLPVLAAGDQRDAGVHGGALGRVPGDRIREIGRLIAVVPEGPVGEPALPGRGIRVEEAADHDAAAGDRLDPQDVPVGRVLPGAEDADEGGIDGADVGMV